MDGSNRIELDCLSPVGLASERIYSSGVSTPAPELFYTPREVATMFRVTPTALNSQRKRGIAPGSLAVKVGGKHLYPRKLIESYLDELARNAQTSLGLDDAMVEDLFRTPPTNTRILTVAEAAERLDVEPSTLEEQWEDDVLPGALGWRATPGADLVFVPRDIDIWTQSNADQSSKDAPSTSAD